MCVRDLCPTQLMAKLPVGSWWVSMVCHQPSLTQAEVIQTLKQNKIFQSSVQVCASVVFSLQMQISHAAAAIFKVWLKATAGFTR